MPNYNLEKRLWGPARQAISELSSGAVKLVNCPIASPYPLYPEEVILIKDASAGRIADFSAGRHAAREALRQSGLAAAPILSGPRGAPQWPPGSGGSISHDGRHAAALAYRTAATNRDFALDLIDGIKRDFTELAPYFLAPSDQMPPATDDGEPLLARVFAAKEAAIKLLSPRLQQWIDFRDLTFRRNGSAFEVRHACLCRPIEGRIWTDSGVLLAVSWLSRGAANERAMSHASSYHG